MRTFPLFLLATFAMIACTGQMESRKENQTDLTEQKTISLQILDKTIWTWTITPKGVKGNGINLQRQDDVIFGYLNDEKVRFSISTEKLVDGKGSLALTQGENSLKLEGISGEMHLQASLDQAGILLANPSISLKLGQVDADETQTTLADSKGQVKLLFGHCEPSLLKKRPELLLLLAKQVLPEAYKSLAN